MTISTIPEFPALGDAAFNSKAYAWALHMANTFVGEANGLAADLASINGGTVSGTSTTSTLIGTGSKTLTTQTGKAFAVGQFVVIANTATPTNWMGTFTVTSVSSETRAKSICSTS